MANMLKVLLTVFTLLLSLTAAQAQFYLGGLPSPGMWLNASNANTSTNGADVNLLNDQTTNNADADNAAGSVTTHPTLNTTLFGTGLPGVVFDGSTDLLHVPNNTVLNDDGNGYSQKNITFVLRTGATLTGKKLIYEQGNEANGLNLHMDGTTMYFMLWSTDCAKFFVQSGVLTANTTYLVSLNYNQTNSTLKLYINGTLADTETPIELENSGGCNSVFPTLPAYNATFPNGFDSLPRHNSNITIGAHRQGTKYFDGDDATGTLKNYFNGGIGEIVSYNSASDALREILENALAQKYGLTISNNYRGSVPASYADLAGVGRFSATDVVATTTGESGGLFISNGTMLANAGDYVMAAYTGPATVSLNPGGLGAPYNGPTSTSDRAWSFAVTDAGANGGTITIGFNIDDLGLPLSSADRYFVTVGGTPLDNTFGTGTIQIVSATQRRILFTLDVNDVDGQSIGTILDGLVLSVGVDAPTTPDETIANLNCNDGLDNDFDALEDILDPGCQGPETPGNANCNDAVDNDGDGLYDCFDPGCNSAGTCDFYYGNPNTACQYTPNLATSFTMVETRSDNADYPIDQRCTVVVGNMGYDDIPDAVAKKPNVNDGVWTDPFLATPGRNANVGRLYVFDGADLDLHVAIQQVAASDYFSQVCIGEVDAVDTDGPEIFVVENDNFLRCYNPTGSGLCTTCLEHTSSQPVQARAMSPQLADFDQDGTAEVYVGNYIFSGVDLTRLVAGSTALSMGKNTGNYDSWPIAYDVFDAYPGLELVAGNKVYAVSLGDGSQDAGSLTEVASAPAGFNDGYTSIADMDRDGDIDIVVMAAGRVYIWDPSTGLQLGTTYTITGTGSRPNIGDFDGDGYPEIGVAGNSNYAAINYDGGASLQALWVVANGTAPGTPFVSENIDDGSSMSGNTLFDFEGDGSVEVIYHDEENLYIWRTETCASPGVGICSALGYQYTPIYAVETRSGTRTDYPLVVDIDADDQPEVVLTSQPSNGPSNAALGYVNKYDCTNVPFVKTRRVWNQNGFFNTNVNDDLTIPRFQQLIHLSNLEDDQDTGPAPKRHYLNGFLSQTTVLDTTGHPIYPSADAAMDNFDPGADIDLDNCNPTGQVTITITVRNDGDATIGAGMPIAVFKNDPYDAGSGPSLYSTTTTAASIAPGGTLTLNVTFTDLNIVTNARNFTVVVNDNGAGSIPYGSPTPNDSLHTGINDCVRINNIYKGTISSCTLLSAGSVDFSATPGKQGVVLNWIADQERDLSHYVIERADASGFYSEIAQVQAIGGANVFDSEYNFTDEAPLMGRSFYRLRLVELDGRTTYSEAREVRFDPAAGSAIVLYPNPAQTFTSLTIDGIGGFGLERMTVYSHSGQTLITDETGQFRDAAKATIGLGNLAPGMYIVKLTGAEAAVWRTLIIE